MAYYPNNFNFNPYQTPQQNQGSLNWVQGESGAKSWLVANGQTVLLMDSENPVFYLKSSDQSGMPLPLRVFDYTERTQATNSANTIADGQFVTREEYNALMGKIEALQGMVDDMQKPRTRKKEGLADE